MKYNTKSYKKTIFFSSTFLFFLPNLLKGEIAIDFFDDGKISYKTSGSKKATKQKIDDEGFDLSIGKKENVFKIYYFEDNNY